MLQTAMESACFGATCKTLKTQAFTDANKCAVPVTVKEDVTDGCKFLGSSLRFLGVSRLTWLRCRAHNTSRDGQLSVANVAGRSLCHQSAINFNQNIFLPSSYLIFRHITVFFSRIAYFFDEGLEMTISRREAQDC